MGMFISSITLKGAVHSRVTQYLNHHERIAWISEPIGGITTIFDKDFPHHGVIERRFSERLSTYKRGETGWEPFVRSMSSELRCIAFVTEVFDSDYYLYELFDSGRLTDEFISDPDPFGNARYFNRPVPYKELLAQPVADHARILCCALGKEYAIDDVAHILANPPYGGGAAEEEHYAVARVLGLAEFAGDTVKFPPV